MQENKHRTTLHAHEITENTTRAHAHTQPLDMVTQKLAHSAEPAPEEALGPPPPSLLEACSSALPALQKTVITGIAKIKS
jgi:hypothetical protein